MGRCQILGHFGQVNEMVRKLRRPDNVGLVDVDVGGASGQPQTVLRELVGGRCRHRHQGYRVARRRFPWGDKRFEVLDGVPDSAGNVENLIGHDRRACSGHNGCESGGAQGATAISNGHWYSSQVD